jgi:hypothetical protein
MELTNPTSTPLPPWCSELIPDLHDAIWSGGGHHDHAAWCALEVLQRRGLLVQSEPEGEAGELVKDLWECADSCTLAEKHGWARVMRRAAELLTRHARPIIKPVPVAERLPGPEDYHPDNDWCWGWYGWRWRMMDSTCFYPGCETTHWLPHHILPLPNSH